MTKLDTGHAMAKAGMLNPDYHLACGAKDRTARVPDPVHYDCSECHSRIVALLEMRIQRPHPVERQQSKLPFMEEV